VGHDGAYEQGAGGLRGASKEEEGGGGATALKEEEGGGGAAVPKEEEGVGVAGRRGLFYTIRVCVWVGRIIWAGGCPFPSVVFLALGEVSLPRVLEKALEELHFFSFLFTSFFCEAIPHYLKLLAKIWGYFEFFYIFH
jgi:hypothetical protein